MLQRLPIAVPQPAANTEWSVAAAGQGWLVKAVSCLLVQGITQTPQPILQIADPGGDILFESFGSSSTQAGGEHDLPLLVVSAVAAVSAGRVRRERSLERSATG